VTLVAAFFTKESFYLLGDTMLSLPKDEAPPGSRQENTYPTHNPSFEAKEHIITDLCQKVVKVAHNLYIGWAGYEYLAIPFIRFLTRECRSSKLTENDVSKAIADYRADHEDMEKGMAFIVVHSASGHFRTWSMNGVRATVDGLGEVILLGTGTEHVARYLNALKINKPPIEPDRSLPTDISSFSLVIEIALGALVNQNMQGAGLDEAWGGGFEILHTKDGENLEKLDNVLFQAYAWFLDEHGEVQTSRMGKRYLQYYDGPDLVIMSQGLREKMGRYVAPPPHERVGKHTTNPVNARPQMLCTFLINRDTRHSRSPIMYDQG